MNFEDVLAEMFAACAAFPNANVRTKAAAMIGAKIHLIVIFCSSPDEDFEIRDDSGGPVRQWNANAMPRQSSKESERVSNFMDGLTQRDHCDDAEFLETITVRIKERRFRTLAKFNC